MTKELSKLIQGVRAHKVRNRRTRRRRVCVPFLSFSKTVLWNVLKYVDDGYPGAGDASRIRQGIVHPLARGRQVYRVERAEHPLWLFHPQGSKLSRRPSKSGRGQGRERPQHTRATKSLFTIF
jgi:hypothetical protein